MYSTGGRVLKQRNQSSNCFIAFFNVTCFASKYQLQNRVFNITLLFFNIWITRILLRHNIYWLIQLKNVAQVVSFQAAYAVQHGEITNKEKSSGVIRGQMWAEGFTGLSNVVKVIIACWCCPPETVNTVNETGMVLKLYISCYFIHSTHEQVHHAHL